MSTRDTILVLTVVVILAGCRPRSNTDNGATNTADSAEATSSVEQAGSTAAPPVESQPNKEATDAALEASTKPAESDTATSDGPDELETGENVPTVEGSRERLLLFAPDGPLLIELVISVSGRPLNDWMQSILDDALELADTDQDGRPLWSEVPENDALREKYFSDNLAANISLAQLKQRYDSNQNEVVDRRELSRLLSGDMSSGQSFGVRGSNYYREVNRFSSPVFRYLDRDTDGELVAAEIEATATQLRSRDFDQDEYIELSDLSLDETPSGEALFRKDEYGTAVAVWLGPRDPWSAVRFGLSELYADGESVSPESFTLTPELFGQLDANQDGRLLLKELASLKEIPPHVVLAVRLGADKSGQDHLSLASMCASLESAGVQVRSEPPWLSLVLPMSQVDFFARDLSEPNEGIVGSQVHVRIGHQADALFAAIDTDRDGRISPRELDRASQVLKSMDRDNDGTLVADEIPDRMLVGLSRGNDQQANDLFTQLPRSEQDQPADVPDWFQSMDQNRDNLLSRREFLGLAEQFDNLDTNRDGYVDVDEL